MTAGNGLLGSVTKGWLTNSTGTFSGGGGHTSFPFCWGSSIIRGGRSLGSTAFFIA